VKGNVGRILTAFLIGFTAVVIIRGTAGCSSGEAAEAPEPAAVQTDEVAMTGDADRPPEGITDLGNTICPVMGNPVMEGQYVDWNGYRVHFCCAGCDAEFLADPEKYLEILLQEEGVPELLEEGDAHCATDETSCHPAEPAGSCPCCG
jgi:hypothetical protein